MQELKQDLKNNDFKSIYLLYGDDSYLKRFYKNQLRNKVIRPDDSMNYAHFDGNSIDIGELISISDTMPFLAEHRLILVENSGFFKSPKDELISYVENIPDTTVMVFVEDEVDKRGRMYKAAAAKGRAVSVESPKGKELQAWVGKYLARFGTGMTSDAYNLLLSSVGTNLETLDKELSKLVDYTYGKEVIRPEDVSAICTVQVENKIFDMIEFIVKKDSKKALDLYYDLLALKEPPMRILFLVAMQFDRLFKAKSMREAGYPGDQISSKMKLADWIVDKSLNLGSRYSLEELKNALAKCAEAETDVKTGKMNDKLSVELLICDLAHR